MKYNQIPPNPVIQKTAEALTANGFKAEIVKTSAEAKTRVLELIPKGAEVFTYTSVTLDTTGISDALNTDEYKSVRNIMHGADKLPGREKQKLGAAPEYAVGSAHAVTEDGHILIASNTGSQLPAHAYGSDHVILVVGAQKLVTDFNDGMKRLYEYVLPLESERAKKAYGAPGSFVSKLLVLNREVKQDRITVIIVEESLGF
ncbi:MAG: LUD domain-containing protein [Weeksellaceae bacterium]